MRLSFKAEREREGDGGEEGGLPWPSRFPFPSSGSEPWLHRDLLGRLKKITDARAAPP